MNEVVETIVDMLDRTFLGNTVRAYLVSLAAILIGLMLVKVVQLFVIRRLRKWFDATSTDWDDMLIQTLEANAVPAVYVFVLYHGLRLLHLKDSIATTLRTLVTVVLTLLAVRLVLRVVNHSIRAYWLRHAEERTEAKEKSLVGITTLVKIAVWTLGFVLLLDNLGIKISAFMAGLGITGIAVALAAQAILGDLFSYFVIFFDQPFEIGHFIRVNGFMGVVEHIGIKTTRLSSLDGEQIVFSNKSLTDSQIQNYKRMKRRRVAFAFEVEYDTPVQTLREIPVLVKEQIALFPDATYDRAHFKTFADSGLGFEVVYYVENPDYNRYMDIQQDINLGLKEEFLARGIGFAFPTRTLYVKGPDGSEAGRKPGEAGGKPGAASIGTGRQEGAAALRDKASQASQS